MIKKVKAMIKLLEEDGWVLKTSKGVTGNSNIQPSQVK